MKNIKTAIILIIFTSLCMTVVAAQPFIVRNDKKRLLVKSLSASEDGVLTYKTQNFSQKLKPGQYLYARIPTPPKSITAALSKYRAKKFKDAAKEFDAAFKTNRYLGWGSFCMYYAGKSFEGLNKKSEALARFEQLKDIPLDKEEIPWFLKAKQLEADMLIADKQFEKATKVLSVISRSGDKKSAMFANNARADILDAEGKSSEALFIYMRNVILFTPDKSKESLKSISKSVEILKKQNNPRAADIEKMQ